MELRPATAYSKTFCVCSFNYLACKAHATYYIVICGLVCLYQIFPHYLIKGATFGGGGGIILQKKKYVLIFPTTFI